MYLLTMSEIKQSINEMESDVDVTTSVSNELGEFNPEKFIDLTDAITSSNNIMRKSRIDMKGRKIEATFAEINLLSKSYIALVQIQTGNKLRLYSMVRNELYNRGLLKKLEEVDEVTG